MARGGPPGAAVRTILARRGGAKARVTEVNRIGGALSADNFAKPLALLTGQRVECYFPALKECHR